MQERLSRNPWRTVKETHAAVSEWVALARRVEKHFPGFEWVGVDPDITLIMRDSRKPWREALATLSPEAAIALTGMTEDEAVELSQRRQQELPFDLTDVEAPNV